MTHPNESLSPLNGDAGVAQVGAVSDGRLRELAAYPANFTPANQVKWAKDMRSLLNELLSRRAANRAGGVEVRKLEWEKSNVADRWTAQYPFGLFEITHYNLDYVWQRGICSERFDTLEAAQAACQADFNQRILSTISLAAEAEPVAQTERVKLHRKIMGMIADKQRYAGVMISGRDLHVIAEALLDRAIEVERSSPVSAEVTVTDEMVERAARAMEPMAFREEFTATDEWYELEQEGRNQALGRARAALTAALDQHGKEG